MAHECDNCLRLCYCDSDRRRWKEEGCWCPCLGLDTDFGEEGEFEEVERDVVKIAELIGDKAKEVRQLQNLKSNLTDCRSIELRIKNNDDNSYNFFIGKPDVCINSGLYTELNESLLKIVSDRIESLNQETIDLMSPFYDKWKNK